MRQSCKPFRALTLSRPPRLKAHRPYAIRGWAAGFRRLGRIMAEASGLMRGKRGLIFGVANNRSLAWGIARACRAQGADVALTYQGDALKRRVEPLAQEIGARLFGHCDVTDSATIDAVFATAQQTWGSLDFVVHAVAF